MKNKNLEVAFNIALKEAREQIIEIRDWIKNLAEDTKLPMDKRMYNILWEKVHDIDKTFGVKKKNEKEVCINKRE